MTRPRLLPVVRVGTVELLQIAAGVRLGIDRAVKDWPARLALAAWAASTAWAAALLLGRVSGLAAPPYDLAFFQQVVWNVGYTGQWASDFNIGSFLGIHFSPILVVPALLERTVWPDVRVLSLLHAVAIGAMVPAAFLFLRALLRPSPFAGALAAALSVGIPVWSATESVIRSDFHPEAAGLVFALLAGWAGLSRRLPAMWLLAIAALLTREDLAYAVLLIGLVVAVRGRGVARRHGRLLAIVAASVAAIVFLVVMPWFRAGAESETTAYYSWLGGGLNVLTAPFTKTELVVAAITRPEAWFVVLGMVASLGGVPLLAPRWLVFLAPPLAAVLLSAHWWQANLLLQYPLILYAPLLVAAGFGGRRALAIAGRQVRRRGERNGMGSRRERSPSRIRGAFATALFLPIPLVAVVGAWAQGSLPPFDHGDPAFFARPASMDRLQRVAQAIPPPALLVVDEGLVAPLAGRASITRLSAYATPADTAYVLLDRAAWTPTAGAARQHDSILAALTAGRRPLLADDGRFVLWGPEPVEAPH